MSKLTEMAEAKSCPECGAKPNDRRDLAFGQAWRQCEECYQEYFTDTIYPSQRALALAALDLPEVRALRKALRHAQKCERERILDDLGNPGLEGCGHVTIETDYDAALAAFDKLLEQAGS